MNEYLKELQDAARQVMEGEGMAVSETVLWPLIVELGWLLTAVPEELDGLGLGVQGSCALHAELGHGLAQAPFLSAGLALDAIVHGETQDKRALLECFTTGELVTASLADEGSAVSLNAEGGLNGRLTAVPSADTATMVLVVTEDCVALVPLEQTERVARASWDTTRRLFDVHLRDLAPAEQVVLARGAAAQALSSRLRTLRDFTLAADAVGGSAGLLALTVEHLQTREQFGRPLALFQSLKHRCADLKTLLAAAEALLKDSLQRVGEDLSELPAQQLAKKSKWIACSAFSTIAEEALQLHGGIGMASEHPCHLFLKRAMLNEQLGAGDEASAIADHFLAALA